MFDWGLCLGYIQNLRSCIENCGGSVLSDYPANRHGVVFRHRYFGSRLSAQMQAHPDRKLPGAVAHSERRLFTGFAKAAFTAWKLMVANAMMMETSPPMANNHQLMLMR